MEPRVGLVAAVEGLLAHLKEVDKGRVHSQEVIGLGNESRELTSHPGDLIRARNSSWPLAIFCAIFYNGHPKL